MKRELIEAYCIEVLGIKQEIDDFREVRDIIFVSFDYKEDYVYQSDIEISLFDLISFVYSKI